MSDAANATGLALMGASRFTVPRPFLREHGHFLLGHTHFRRLANLGNSPRATLIQPWSLVGSSCGFNANCQRSKESTDDFPRRRVTGAAQAPGQLSEIWGPRANYTFGAPVNHNYPPRSVDKLFISLQICICRPSLSWGRGENCSLCPCLIITIYFK